MMEETRRRRGECCWKKQVEGSGSNTAYIVVITMMVRASE